MKIISKRQAMAIYRQHPQSRLFRFCTGKYQWSGSICHYAGQQVIQQHIDAGISLADALNFIVEKYELIRTDRPGFSIQHQSPFISAIDILRARKATGLMQRTGYKAVTCAISGQSSGGQQ